MDAHIRKVYVPHDGDRVLHPAVPAGGVPTAMALSSGWRR